MIKSQKTIKAVFFVMAILVSPILFTGIDSFGNQNAYGETLQTIEYKTTGGMIYRSGNWIVNSTEKYVDANILLSGNLIIQTGGILTFKNTTLFINNTLLSNPLGIRVKDGGQFNIWDVDDDPLTTEDGSKLDDSPYDRDDLGILDYRYYFIVEPGGLLDINNSEIEECGFYNTEKSIDTWGLYIESDGNRIRNTTFINSGRGVILMNAQNNLLERINSTNVHTSIQAVNANNTIIRQCWLNGTDNQYAVNFYNSVNLTFIKNKAVSKYTPDRKSVV